MCHILFLLPFIALILFFLLPPVQATFISVPLFLVFLWLAWVTWKDMRRPVPMGIEGLMGAKGQVARKTRDGAKVLLRGELWDAVSDDELMMRDTVKVTRFERMKLVVHKEMNSRG
jgi:membrane protein implicated in regulation of membrane protease activity